MKKRMGAASLVILLSTLNCPSSVQAQWQSKEEFYSENRSTGLQVYYSPEFYAEKDPENNNYREYRYSKTYGKDYYWENYDGGIYSERQFVSRYNALSYYTDNNDDLTDWGQQMGVAGAIAGICCVLICFGVICTQCIVRRRKRQKELKAQKDKAEMEGIEMENESDLDSVDPNESSKGDTDDLAATKIGADDMKKKKKKKSTKAMRQAALDQKAKEGSKSKNDPTVVADFSRDDDSASDNVNGSRREMLANANTVRDDDRAEPVGNKRFDVNQDGAEDLP